MIFWPEQFDLLLLCPFCIYLGPSYFRFLLIFYLSSFSFGIIPLFFSSFLLSHKYLILAVFFSFFILRLGPNWIFLAGKQSLLYVPSEGPTTTGTSELFSRVRFARGGEPDRELLRLDLITNKVIRNTKQEPNYYQEQASWPRHCDRPFRLFKI